MNADSCEVNTVGEPDAGNPPVRFDGGAVVTRTWESSRIEDSHAANAHHRPTLPSEHPKPKPRFAERTHPVAPANRHRFPLTEIVRVWEGLPDPARPRGPLRRGLRRP